MRAMTVRELIEALQKLPQDLPVYSPSLDSEAYSEPDPRIDGLIDFGGELFLALDSEEDDANRAVLLS